MGRTGRGREGINYDQKKRPSILSRPGLSALKKPWFQKKNEHCILRFCANISLPLPLVLPDERSTVFVVHVLLASGGTHIRVYVKWSPLSPQRAHLSYFPIYTTISPSPFLLPNTLSCKNLLRSFYDTLSYKNLILSFYSSAHAIVQDLTFPPRRRYILECRPRSTRSIHNILVKVFPSQTSGRC